MRKELPVIYAVFDDQGLVHALESESDVARVMLPGRTRVNYIPDVTHCRDCESFQVVPCTHNGQAQGDCDEMHGLTRPKGDGSDYCPYAKRKETK
jgi:hypothetical protein